ncbi:MAG: hypothetical protein ACU85V_17040 [Gammaproteobacteria bacterium]
MSARLSAADETEALERLHELGLTDGLPVVVPTVPRVERMVLASGVDADIELGEMGPGYGIATVEKVACAAVMAGCLPDHMPVVVAAVRAVCDPAFDLTEMQCTTHCIAPMVVVCGPAAAAGGYASGFGLMGPGHRANAATGRALRLAMINIGGARPGESDMAIHGSPAKFSFCFAEAAGSSPFPPLHAGFGYAPDDSAVVVLGTEGPHSVLFSGDADDPRAAEALLDAVAAVVANRGSNNSYLGGRAAVAVVFNPEHAAVLAQAGYDRAGVQQAVAARAVTAREVLAAVNGKMLVGDEAMIPAVRKPEQVLVMTAGAPGLYSMVMPSWCAGPHGNVAVHAPIELDQYCELPAAGAR